MKFARFMFEGEEGYGIVNDGSITKLRPPYRDENGIELFLKGEMELSSEIIQISDDKIKWLPPIANPRKIICVGRNYLAHSEEQGKKPEKAPLLFSKFKTSMTGHGSRIRMPSTGQFLDYEVELAVIVGNTIDAQTEKPLQQVFGYTVANDLTLRDIQKKDPGSQWTRGKGFDQSLPIGPTITTIDEIKDIRNLDIWLSVNGDMRQRSNTGKMIYDIQTLLTYISESITLEAGDILLTGTPEGVGAFMEPPHPLKDGDVVNCGISNVCELKFAIGEEIHSKYR